MTANTVFREVQQLSQPSEWVELFTLDCSNIGGTIYRFTPNIYTDGSYLTWQGHTFGPMPISFSGWEVVSSASGASSTQPRPSITISNANKTLLAAVIALGDLVGSKFTRVRTFRKFLDGQPAADTTQYIGPDIFTIAQKTSHNKTSITWQMAGVMDQPGRMFPARQVTKDATLISGGFPGVSVY